MKRLFCNIVLITVLFLEIPQVVNAQRNPAVQNCINNTFNNESHHARRIWNEMIRRARHYMRNRTDPSRFIAFFTLRAEKLANIYYINLLANNLGTRDNFILETSEIFIHAIRYSIQLSQGNLDQARRELKIFRDAGTNVREIMLTFYNYSPTVQNRIIRNMNSLTSSLAYMGRNVANFRSNAHSEINKDFAIRYQSRLNNFVIGPLPVRVCEERLMRTF